MLQSSYRSHKNSAPLMSTVLYSDIVFNGAGDGFSSLFNLLLRVWALFAVCEDSKCIVGWSRGDWKWRSSVRL